MMKIAIISCYFIDNYGSILQSYATQKYLTNQNLDCQTVSIEKLRPFLNSAKKRYYLNNIFNFGLLMSKFPMIKLKLLEKFNIQNLGTYIRSRREGFEDFRKLFSFTHKKCANLEELNELSKKYDVVVLGGDQLWRPDNIFPGYYTLEWVDENTRRVSLATSFGISHLDSCSQKRARSFLNDFDALSVREKEGVDIIFSLTNKTAILACDPVFLLSADEWKSIADTSLCPDGDYIFTYFLGDNKKHREFVKSISKKTGLPIVSIPFVDSYTKADNDADLILPQSSPQSFLGLISNAKYVCTDSFHATAFSVMFEKQFITLKRFSTKKGNTNSRISSFLSSIGLASRCVEPNEFTDEVFDDIIDYEEAKRKLEIIKSKTLNYIESEIIKYKEKTDDEAGTSYSDD